jgi:hypothetical protein
MCADKLFGRKMLAMNHESCPELYNCPRVKMTPLIRVLLCCTAAEAMESICASCEQKQAQGERDDNYVAPSGRKVKVVVEDGAEQMAGASIGSNPGTGFIAG